MLHVETNVQGFDPRKANLGFYDSTPVAVVAECFFPQYPDDELRH